MKPITNTLYMLIKKKNYISGKLSASSNVHIVSALFNQ